MNQAQRDPFINTSQEEVAELGPYIPDLKKDQNGINVIVPYHGCDYQYKIFSYVVEIHVDAKTQEQIKILKFAGCGLGYDTVKIEKPEAS